MSFTGVERHFKAFRFVSGDFFGGPPRLSGEILRAFTGTSDAFQCVSDITEKSLETQVPMGVLEAFQ